jgi:hypothetical protein
MISVGSVFASSSASKVDVWTDPVATANNGAAFTSTILDTASLPGIVDDDASMILPVGFTTDSGQFGGNGIVITGLATHTDTVSLTFSFPTYRYGWTGSIYQWSGSAWVKVATTIVAPTGENSMYYATASGLGNGTYALIMGYEGAAE